jgi:hypothetical protein
VKPVRNRTTGGLVGARTLGLILHVQAGDGALSGWFNNPTAQASSTWWAGKAGAREQYGNPDTDKFWAQAAGNTTYHSIETEGQPSQPLTPAQIETVAVAYAWGHTRYGWPFRLAEKPGETGLGWHGMGGKAWGGHTGCPGDLRKAQRSQILARAQQIAGGTTAPQEDDMPTPAELWGYKAPGETKDAYEYLRNEVANKAADLAVDRLLHADVIPAPVKQDGNPTWTVGASLEWTGKGVIALQATVAALQSAVTALAEAKGADAEAITKAVVDKIAALTFNLDPKES